MYSYIAPSTDALLADEGDLWAFVSDTPGVKNYYDVLPNSGTVVTGHFIKVPKNIATGLNPDGSEVTSADVGFPLPPANGSWQTDLRTTAPNVGIDGPQWVLEYWSDTHNVFQFVRVEDVAYDPDNPREVYFADTGNSRLIDPGTGRLYRAPSGTPGTTSSNGRIFKIVMNAADPTKVDSFSIVGQGDNPAAAGYVPFRAPDNIDVGHNSLMVQEDASNAKIWMFSLSSGTWTHVATATQPSAETSGIVDLHTWFGAGWWALDVQSHVNIHQTPGVTYTGPGPNNGVVHTQRREDGQLLLMYIPGS